MIRADNSMLECVATCSQRFVLQYILGKRAGNQGPLVAGRAMHKGLEEYYKDSPWVIAAVEKCYEGVDESEFEPRHTCNNVVDVLSAWLKTYGQKDKTFTPVHHELSFELPFSGDYIMCGKIDLVVRSKANGTLSPLDFKFSGQVNAGWWKSQWRLKGQMIDYCWAMRELYAEPVGTAYVYGIKATTLPQPGRKCKTHGVDFAECRDLHLVVEVVDVYYDEQQILDWKQTTQALFQRVEMLKEVYSDGAPWNANQEGRFNGGCTFCEFQQWCAAGRPESWIEGWIDAEKEPWKII